MCVYLDNASTTKPSNSAITAINICLTENYGNPSSLHSLGVKAQQTMEKSRKSIATAIACDSSSIYFTSGATESNNLAISSSAKIYGKRKKKIVASAIEHPSVNEALKRLEDVGFEVVKIKPHSNGKFNSEDFIEAVDSNTFMISMMMVNNETGDILPVKKVFYAVKRLYPDVITHTDAVQGFMKIPVKITDIQADLISLSGHKVYSAKGIGAIFVRKGVRLCPTMIGGNQEKGYRSGTESVPLIAGFGASVSELYTSISDRELVVAHLKEELLHSLNDLENIVINSPFDASPYIINFSVVGIRSEIMLHHLESKGIYVSSGSACSKVKKSSVLMAMGLDDDVIDSAIRVSLSHTNTTEDIKALVSAIKEGQNTIIHTKIKKPLMKGLN